jgi:Septum formation
VTSLAELNAGDPQQPAHPGQAGPQGNQWHGSAQPLPRRRRARWLWAAGGAAACGAVIAALVVSLGSGHSAASVRHSPQPTRPTATPTPTAGNLQLAQLQVGDCLTGANMQLNTSNPWPKLTLAVPCSQPHTAEVFFADNNFWSENSPFPGSSTISKDGNTACDKAFQSYVGIPYTKSMYTWTNIIPDASTWPTGDRGLHCIAYYSTTKQSAGASITGSIRGARK